MKDVVSTNIDKEDQEGPRFRGGGRAACGATNVPLPSGRGGSIAFNENSKVVMDIEVNKAKADAVEDVSGSIR